MACRQEELQLEADHHAGKAVGTGRTEWLDNGDVTVSGSVLKESSVEGSDAPHEWLGADATISEQQLLAAKAGSAQDMPLLGLLVAVRGRANDLELFLCHMGHHLIAAGAPARCPAQSYTLFKNITLHDMGRDLMHRTETAGDVTQTSRSSPPRTQLSETLRALDQNAICDVRRAVRSALLLAHISFMIGGCCSPRPSRYLQPAPLRFSGKDVP